LKQEDCHYRPTTWSEEERKRREDLWAQFAAAGVTSTVGRGLAGDACAEFSAEMADGLMVEFDKRFPR